MSETIQGLKDNVKKFEFHLLVHWETSGYYEQDHDMIQLMY